MLEFDPSYIEHTRQRLKEFSPVSVDTDPDAALNVANPAAGGVPHAGSITVAIFRGLVELELLLWTETPTPKLISYYLSFDKALKLAGNLIQAVVVRTEDN